MTATMRRAQDTRQRAPVYRPHVKRGVAEIVRQLLQLDTVKAAQCRMDRCRTDAEVIATAFHLSSEPAGITEWAVRFDAVRNHGAALPFSLDVAAVVARAERTQDECREAFLAQQTREHLLTWERKVTFEISQKQELLLSIRAELGKAL